MCIKKFWKDPLEIKLFTLIGGWGGGLRRETSLLFTVTFLYFLILELHKFKSFNARKINCT